MRFPLRRRFLVSRSQIHLIAFNVVYYVVFTLVLSTWLLEPLVRGMTDGGTDTDRAATARMLLYMHARLWPLAALMVVVSALHSVFITHRVAGPLVRFRRVFRDIAAGRLVQQIVLRKKDYLDDEAEELNSMCAVLVSRVNIVRACHRRITDELEELEELEHSVRSEHGTEPRFGNLRRRLDELQSALDWFQCGEDDSAALPDVENAASLVPEPTGATEPTTGGP